MTPLFAHGSEGHYSGMDIVYFAEASSGGTGRDGRVRSGSGRIDQDLTTPKALGGSGEEGTNPEELFAATYSACFHGALGLAASEKKVSLSESAVDAEVGIGPDGDSFAITATITARLPGLDQETADALVERAHELCPYSKATRGNIEVTVAAVTD